MAYSIFLWYSLRESRAHYHFKNICCLVIGHWLLYYKIPTLILIPYFSEGYPPLVFPTMQLMVEALNLHVISVTWDLQYLTCLAESSRTKIKPLEVTDMISGTQVSKPGRLFYDTLLVSFILFKKWRNKIKNSHCTKRAVQTNPFICGKTYLSTTFYEMQCTFTWMTNIIRLSSEKVVYINRFHFLLGYFSGFIFNKDYLFLSIV